MRVNDQEDMFIAEASCLPYLRPDGMIWPMTSGASWSSCCPGGKGGTAAGMGEAAVHRRDPLADPDRLALA
jgi:hypothetical protein